MTTSKSYLMTSERFHRTLQNTVYFASVSELLYTFPLIMLSGGGDGRLFDSATSLALLFLAAALMTFFISVRKMDERYVRWEDRLRMTFVTLCMTTPVAVPLIFPLFRKDGGISDWGIIATCFMPPIMGTILIGFKIGGRNA
ncbi:MAG: hypothetical protein HGA31_06925 [Candidatus Moranbacteria bacterium]|nr:hypothetical protein [Candidatus Moranbacteria bacterium]